MLRTLLAFCVIFCMGVYVYAFDSVQNEQPNQAPISCLPPFVSGAVLRISEIGFDGTDERIEITNIGDTSFQDTLTISGAKSKALTYPNFLLLAGETVIIGDTLSHFTGDIPIFATGQGLSLPDTTGFSLVLFTATGILDSLTFSHDTIFSIPNGVALEALFSGDSRERVWGDETRTILSDSFANPGGLYCLAPEEIVTPILSGDNQDTGTVDISDDVWTGNSGEDLVLTGFEDTGDDLGNAGTGDDVLVDLTGFNDSGISITPPQTGYLDLGVPLINQNLDHTNSIPPCSVSEIHSVAGVLPEYIEVFCQRSFSGTLVFSGLGAGASVKSIALNVRTGSYAILASDISAFYDTGAVYIFPGISLLDVGETITLMISGYNSLSYTYSALEKNSSYYPFCSSGSSCVGLTSPGFSYFYIAGYTANGSISTVISSSSDTSPTTNTYYQGLYQTRKAKAVQYEKDISGLKKTVTTLQKQTKTPSTGSGSSTKVVKKTTQATSKTAKNSATNTSKSSSSAKTPTKKTTTSKIASKTPAKTTTKTTTPKEKTVSTTSKAYVLLADEHKIYKAYIAFLHDYLQDHLFGQYKTLKIPTIESLLKKSLQAVKKQNYTFALVTGASLSSFDFPAQWKTINQTKSLDIARNPLANTVLSVVHRMPISFLEKLYTKHTLLVGSILSRSDI